MYLIGLVVVVTVVGTADFIVGGLVLSFNPVLTEGITAVGTSDILAPTAGIFKVEPSFKELFVFIPFSRIMSPTVV